MFLVRFLGRGDGLAVESRPRNPGDRGLISSADGQSGAE